MYNYSKSKSIIGNSDNTKFLELLKKEWDNVHNNTEVFRYKINNLQERLVDEKYLLQLNPDRGSKRRMPEQIHNINQPFDENKFNFTKISPSEVLFDIKKDEQESKLHSLIVNVSPISRYHTLLCPSVYKCQPQVITEESLVVAFEVMFLAGDRDLRIGFNSLCGMASVNHLHYHLFFEPHTLPVETAKCKHIKGPLYTLENYPAPGFCFQIQSEESILETSKQITTLTSYLLKNSIAHNIFITRGQSVDSSDHEEIVRIIIWPRKSCSGAKTFTTLNVAVVELSGWFPIYDETEFMKLKTEDLENELNKWKYDDFDKLCEDVKLSC